MEETGYLAMSLTSSIPCK